ncbi:hypothetical protein [Variovorax sp. EL159]|uniref:hypothetical protein n=1 Tax=Variovorax sp. EL159 TaxID=1566270 RepID=UPI000880B4BB|nr:hypothetical protein [Variovorax sp. EL159]SCX73496.1 hypothetical protein SAMN03159363_5228 [Variovorax sp. EL159]
MHLSNRTTPAATAGLGAHARRRAFLAACAACVLTGCGTYVPDHAWQRVSCKTPRQCTDEEYAGAVKSTPVFVRRDGWWTYRQALPADTDPARYIERRVPKAYLEFNAEGWPHDVNQWNAVERYLKNTHKPLFVLVYVHGWHQNASTVASDESENAVKFDDLLARTKDSLVRKFPDGRVPDVLGIYVGWQGEVYDGGYRWFRSVGSRAGVANAIAANRSPDGVRGTLDAVAKAMRETHPESRMVVMGHSFGGRLLSRAFVPDFIEGRSQPLGERVLVNTVNAAIGADYFSPLYAKGFARAEALRPSWINMTSKEDWATGWIYPKAFSLGWLKPEWSEKEKEMEKDREVVREEEKASGTTIGHFPAYITHVLDVMRCSGSDCRKVEDHVDANAWEQDAGKGFEYNQFVQRYAWLPPVSDVPVDYCGVLVRRPMLSMQQREELRSKAVCNVADVNFDYLQSKGSRDGFPPSERRVPAQGRMWNIETSESMLNFRVPSLGGVSVHNGYVSTAWTRMLVDLIYEPDYLQIWPPAPSAGVVTGQKN